MTTKMQAGRSDLALEAAENLGFGTAKWREMAGVTAVESRRRGYGVTAITVSSARASAALDKPMGRYVTIDLRPYFRREAGFFPRAAECVAAELRSLLPSDIGRRPVLVAGLGNGTMAADAMGPTAVGSLLVTRHMVRSAPRQFGQFTAVAALCPGVLAQSGMETLETVRAVVREICPGAVVVIDALAASSRQRLCATVQLSDAGLAPGSGVGNHRLALTEDTLGVPVAAVGVPTVMDAAHLCPHGEGEAPVFLTPRDIDSRVRELGRIVGYGVTLALQPQLNIEDITGLLG